jgi:hypothetical protein
VKGHCDRRGSQLVSTNLHRRAAILRVATPIAISAVFVSVVGACSHTPGGTPGNVFGATPTHSYPNDPPKCDQPVRTIEDPYHSGGMNPRVFNDTDFISDISPIYSAIGQWCGEVTDANLVQVARAIPQKFPDLCDHDFTRIDGHVGQYWASNRTDHESNFDEAIDYLFRETKGPIMSGRSDNATQSHVYGGHIFVEQATAFYCPLKPGERSS